MKALSLIAALFILASPLTPGSSSAEAQTRPSDRPATQPRPQTQLKIKAPLRNPEEIRQEKEFRRGYDAYIRRDFDTAVTIWTALADQGHIKSMKNLGTMYAQGKAVGRNYSLAMLWYRRSGTSAEYLLPKGGIFIWVTLPDAVDTTKLAEVALAEGVALNPGAGWSSDPESGRHRLRLCFGHPSHKDIREGVARLAEICHRETGIPVRSTNTQRD